MADAFDALVAPKEPPKAADPFDALVSAPAQQAPQEDPFATLVAQKPVEERAKEAVLGAIPEPAKQAAAAVGEFLSQGAVGKALDYLDVPQTGATSIGLKALDIIRPGIERRLNPGEEFLPRALDPSDVLYDLLPKNDQVQRWAQKVAKDFGVENPTGDGARLWYAATKGTLGMAADFVLDPVNLVLPAIGPAAKGIAKSAAAAKAAETAGKVAKAIPGAEAVAKGVQATAEGVADTLRSLIPYTFRKELDDALVLHAGIRRGNITQVAEEVLPKEVQQFTAGERRVLFSALESVPNDAPAEQIAQAVKKAAPSFKISIDDTRAQEIASAGKKYLRDPLERNIQFEQELGTRDPMYGKIVKNAEGKSIRLGVLDGYVPHRMSDNASEWAERFRAAKLKKMAEAPEEIVNNVLKEEFLKAAEDVGGSIRGSWINDYDIGKKQRNIRVPVEQANEYLKNRVGVDDFFINDPFVATAIKIAETRNLKADMDLLEVVKKYGIDAEKAPSGWKHIEHRSLSTVKNLKFPPDIAEKVGHYLSKPSRGWVMQKIDQYNHLFKRLALARPDYYIQNIGENSLRAMADGANPIDFAHAIKVASGRDVMIPTSGKVKQMLSARQLRKEIVELGIDSGGIFKEGMDSFVNMGKKMTRDGVINKTVDAPKKLLANLMEFGEGAENWTRRAHYISLRRAGLSPKEAAIRTERILFDYSRTTPAMDNLRRVFPFIQPAIKVAYTAPELVAKNPKLFNFLNNNMFQAMQAAFNDPVTDSELEAVLGKTVAAKYKQLKDPSFSVILPGNHWLAKLFYNDKTPQYAGGNVMVQAKAPIGLDILDQFTNLSGSFGPIAQALSTILTGKDVYTGKSLDASRDSIDWAKRLNSAANTIVLGALPLPNTIKGIKNISGISDPQWIEPATVLALQGSIGKFASVTNLDKDFMFKAVAMQRYHKELVKEFMGRVATETQNVPTQDKASIMAARIRDWSQAAYRSERTYSKILDNQFEAQRVAMARAGLVGAMKPEEILRNIREIQKNIKELNHAYRTSAEYRAKVLSQMKSEMEQQENPPKESDGE